MNRLSILFVPCSFPICIDREPLAAVFLYFTMEIGVVRMLILKLKDVRKEWNGVTLFDHVALEIYEGERIALFGRNGIGKTTLLQCILGRAPLEGGSVQREIPLEQWGILNQQVETEDSLTVIEFVQSCSEELYRIKQMLDRLQTKMNEGLDASSLGNTSDVWEQYSDLYSQYLQLDGYAWEANVEKCLRKMKIAPSLWTLEFSQLSGGQKTRAQLAALMVQQPKFVVLDEPTNHLDAETLEWLEQWVRTYSGTVLYVSHDRAFIDRTATSVIELDSSGCRRYAGGYTDFRQQKELEWRTQETLHKKQEHEREKLLESIRRYSEWFQQSHKAAGQNDFLRSKAKKNVSRLHAKESTLERLEHNAVSKPREAAKLNMQLEGDGFSASTLLSLEDVSFGYTKERALFQQFHLSVNRGDRIAVLGPNGAGKSTLLKLATGILQPSKGIARLHPQTKIGYFAQELGNLHLDETILDSLLKLPEMTQTQARTIMGCFLFSRDDVFKKIKDLSMGEKCRVAFLKLFFGRSNLLVLDEPTNYLDIDTRERVEDALQHYPGALLIVTHDRYLICKAANRLVIMEEQAAPRYFPGTYDEYMSRNRKHQLNQEEQTRENEREQLELLLAQLIGSPKPEQAEEQGKLIQEIRRLHAEIAALKSILY